ncbi:hypothetical protein ACTGJ9_039570 [Bradyrhizobium sp. RDM12]
MSVERRAALQGDARPDQRVGADGIGNVDQRITRSSVAGWSCRSARCSFLATRPSDASGARFLIGATASYVFMTSSTKPDPIAAVAQTSYELSRSGRRKVRRQHGNGSQTFYETVWSQTDAWTCAWFSRSANSTLLTREDQGFP